MNDQPTMRDVFLHPGDVQFADESAVLRTLLGSCVAITLWHPKLRIGGMCHYLLPDRMKVRNGAALSGRFGDEAMEILMTRVWEHQTDHREYEAKVFGGGNMFPDIMLANPLAVGERNVAQAAALLEQFGLKAAARHVGDAGHRSVVFEIRTGQVWMKHHLLEKKRC